MSKNFGFSPELICCRKTTEKGVDEVIFRVIAVCSNPQKNMAFDYGPYDMNDGEGLTDNIGGTSKCITKVSFQGNLVDSAIDRGDRWIVTVILNEIDGGDTASAQQLLAGMLVESGNPYAMVAGGVLEGLTKLGVKLENKDDYIGAVSFRLDNNNGIISTGFIPVAQCRINDEEKDQNGEPRKIRCTFDGSGSDYDCYFYIDLYQ